MLPQCGRSLFSGRTEIPGKEGAKAICCREFRSKAYPCQESESALVEGSVVPPQIRGLGVCRTRCVGTNMALSGVFTPGTTVPNFGRREVLPHSGTAWETPARPGEAGSPMRGN